MKKTKNIVTKSVATSAVAALALNAFAVAPAMADTTATATAATNTSLAGATRIETANKIAEASWTGAWKGQTTAVLAAAEDSHLVDGLAVAPLAYQQKAPILLSYSGDSITPSTLAEIVKNKVTKVYIATGTGVITDKAAQQLKDNGVTTIVRLGGTTRYETAQKIAAQLGTVTKVAVVNGQTGLADAMSIAPIAASQNIAIALSNGKDKTDTVDLTGKTVYAVGGIGVLPDTAVGVSNAVRLGGTTRFETNAAVVDQFKSSLKFDSVFLADGANEHLIDSLTGSVYAAQTQSPIVLTGTEVGAGQQTVLNSNLTGNSAITTFGDTISATVKSSVQTIIDGKKSVSIISNVTVDKGLSGVTFVNVQLSASNPQDYDVTFKGQAPVKYDSATQTFTFQYNKDIALSDINKDTDIKVTSKAKVADFTADASADFPGKTFVCVTLNVSDAENYTVTFKGQPTKYYASSNQFKIAYDGILTKADINASSDFTVTRNK